VAQVELPDKLYFKIGEVAKIVGVKPYVLRYWETEFSVVKPGKTPSRHRLYRRRDVEMLLEIKHLLYKEGYTIAGAKKRLKETQREEPEQLLLPVTEEAYKKVLSSIKQEILSLCELLNGTGK
jgi:DNA-binding transcriptional MerR regulator